MGYRTAAVLVLSFMAAASCGGDSAIPTSTPTLSPRPTPTPTAGQRLEAAASQMSALTSLTFRLTHEQGHTSILEGVQANTIAGEVSLPDQASVNIQAQVLGFFARIQLIVSAEQAFMTDPLSGTWQSLPASDLPFNFLNLGTTLADIARSVGNSALSSGQSIDGVPTQVVTGTVTGLDLNDLIPVARPDAQVQIELWVDTEGLVRRVRLTGPLVSEDVSDVVRVLDFSRFNTPVNIAVPQ